MTEPTKIEPYYQAHAKEVVDFLFDKGYFSDTLSRDGMDDVEGLLALYLQLDAQSAARCAEMSKKFKARSARQKEPWVGGEDQPRHEEEMRWIARAREAEAAGIITQVKVSGDAAKWALEVGVFLKNILEPPFGVSGRACFMEASRLFTDAIALDIIPEPDCRPGKDWEVMASDGCACPPETPFPGEIIPSICPKCGGRKI